MRKSHPVVQGNRSENKCFNSGNTLKKKKGKENDHDKRKSELLTY